MKHLNYFLIIFILIIQNANSQDLLLTGKLSGFKDGTKIILNTFLDNMDIDMDHETTLLLKNGEFKFAKHLDKPTKFSLRVRPSNPENIVEYEYLYFWAENTSMSLTGTKGQVFQSLISGSVIQDQYFEYITSVSTLENMIKQIADSVKTLPNLSEVEKSKMRIRYYPAHDTIEKKRLEFIYRNPNYYCSAPQLVFYITFLPDQVEKQKLLDFYTKLSPDFRSNVYGKQINSFLKKNKSNIPTRILETGDYPYNFTLKDTSGKEIKFSTINNRIILLDFWGSGCGPCKLEHKNYVQLYNEFKDKGFEIVSVSADQSRKRLMNAMKEDKMNWISLWDEKKEVSRDLYKVQGIPINYLIVEGKIVAKNLRGADLRQMIEKFLNNN